MISVYNKHTYYVVAFAYYVLSGTIATVANAIKKAFIEHNNQQSLYSTCDSCVSMCYEDPCGSTSILITAANECRRMVYQHLC